MSTRKVFASLAIASAVLLGTTGCSLSHDVASLQDYAPSDGQQVQVGDLKMRNAFVLVKDGQVALFGSVVNSGLTDLDAAVQFIDGNGTPQSIPFPVSAGEKVDLGYNGTAPILLEVEAAPGALVSIKLLDGVNPGKSVNVPVLNGEDPHYADLYDAF